MSPPTRPALSVDDLPMLFDEPHRAWATVVREAVAEVEAIEEATTDHLSSARAIVAALGRRGLLAQFAPDPRSSFDLRAVCLAREGIAGASGNADSLFAVQGLGTFPIRSFGSESQRSRLLGPLRDGVRIGAFALTEPEAGTDAGSMQTTATRVDDGWILDGEKVFISNAPVADHLIVFARLAGDAASKRPPTAAFVVEAPRNGLEIEGPTPVIADHVIGSVRLRRCKVGVDALLGREGDGFSIAMATLDMFRVSVGAAAVGMARRALDEAIAHAARRHQFGRPIGEFQQIQAYLADSLAELDAARMLVYRAAYLRDHGAASITQEAAVAKMFATEAAQRIIDRAVQIHGGLGVRRGSVVERLYREIRPLRIYEGTTEIQRVIVGKKLVSDAIARQATDATQRTRGA
jgi:acyl-CoA dehydrogenase